MPGSTCARTPGTSRAILELLQAAFAGGVDIVQIRQKDMKPEAELAVLEIARQAAGPYQGIVCVNDSPAGRTLPGGHAASRSGDGSSARARRYMHPWALLGRSTHAPRQVDKAIKDRNVDYLCVGPGTPRPPNRITSRLALTWSAMPRGKRQ